MRGCRLLEHAVIGCGWPACLSRYPALAAAATTRKVPCDFVASNIRLCAQVSRQFSCFISKRFTAVTHGVGHDPAGPAQGLSWTGLTCSMLQLSLVVGRELAAAVNAALGPVARAAAGQRSQRCRRSPSPTPCSHRYARQRAPALAAAVGTRVHGGELSAQSSWAGPLCMFGRSPSHVGLSHLCALRRWSTWSACRRTS